MADVKDKKKKDRRKFLSGMGKGIAAAGIYAGISSCDPGSYLDYMEGDDVDRVDDRFNESMAGHAKELVFPVADSENFSFLWASDIHITEGQPHFMDKLGFYADEVGAKFVLHSGDCVDKGLDTGFRKWVRVMDTYISVPLITAIGNHDLYNEGWDLFKKYIGPSVYRFEYGQCDFFFLDVANGTLGRDQMHWLEKTLYLNKSKGCRFALGHYPIYSGSIQTPGSMGNTEERMKLIYLFDEYEVDYYLCGHMHMGNVEEVRDTTHIVAGAGSAYKQIIDDDYHFWRFDVRGNRVSKDKIYYDDIRVP